MTAVLTYYIKLVGKNKGSQTRVMLPEGLGGTAKWGKGLWRDIQSKNGVLLYGREHGYYNSTSNKFRNTNFEAINRSVANLGETKAKVAFSSAGTNA
ncbi:hypothetical protein ACERII_21765 [Evansella sp. AB-rgal1]|uniref:hypothetical protein n=1 Tax=Evansella sp. AB-rgal1 TaxID=3242696 RepID=UPI00359CC2C9